MYMLFEVACACNQRCKPSRRQHRTNRPIQRLRSAAANADADSGRTSLPAIDVNVAGSKVSQCVESVATEPGATRGRREEEGTRRTATAYDVELGRDKTERIVTTKSRSSAHPVTTRHYRGRPDVTTFYHYDETLYRRPDPGACYDRWMARQQLARQQAWVPAIGEALALSQEEYLHIGEIGEQEARRLYPAAFSE
jgi:hypothetical protein